MVRASEDAGGESRRARALWRAAELLLLLTVYFVVAISFGHGSWTHLLVFGAIYLLAALALGQLRERIRGKRQARLNMLIENDRAPQNEGPGSP